MAIADVGIIVLLGRGIPWANLKTSLKHRDAFWKTDLVDHLAGLIAALAQARESIRQYFANSLQLAGDNISSNDMEIVASWMVIWSLQGDHANYYRQALRFLGCIDITQLTQDRRYERAYSLSLAALLGKFSPIAQTAVIDRRVPFLLRHLAILFNKPKPEACLSSRNYVKSSFLQRGLSMTKTWTQVLSILSQTLQLLSYPAIPIEG